MNLEGPVAQSPGFAVPARRGEIARSDVGLDGFPADLLVRELADQVPGVHAAGSPPGIARQPRDLAIQLRASGVRMPGEPLPGPGEPAISDGRDRLVVLE